MKVEDTKENLSICMDYCGTCPSLPFPPQPMLFCSRGKSPEKIERKGCKCAICPVHKKYELDGMYYCESGSSP